MIGGNRSLGCDIAEGYLLVSLSLRVYLMSQVASSIATMMFCLPKGPQYHIQGTVDETLCISGLN